jgi:hypothetical protein
MNDWYRRSGISDPYSTITEPVYQNIKEKLVSAPTLSIVSKTEAKNYMKMSSDTTDDNLVEQLISASTGMIEKELGGVAICQQTWKQYQHGGCETIELQREPIIGTPTVSYFDSFETTTATTLTATVDFRVLENELFHADGYFVEGREGDGYTIEYDVGMFTASTYTSSNDPRLSILKSAILRTCAWLYENREQGMVNIKEGNWSVTYNNVDIPANIKRLIMPLSTGRGLI